MAWHLEGSYFEHCPCDQVCPRITSAFTAPADVERCLTVLALPGVLAQGIRGHRHHVAAVTEILGDYYAAPGQPGHARTRRTPEGAVS